MKLHELKPAEGSRKKTANVLVAELHLVSVRQLVVDKKVN